MKRLAIIGSGDLGQLIAYHASNDNHYSIAGFVDDFEELDSFKVGIPILGSIKDVIELLKQDKFDCIMIGIGYKHMTVRKAIFEMFIGRVPFGKIIHTSAYVDSSSIIGNGSFILPNCTLDKHVIIGENVLLNTATVIAHDSKVDSHCFLAPGVNVAGKVHINECCVIGIGTTIIDNILIKPSIKTGAGAVVIENLTQSGLYLGVPAILKKLY
jgi:sugar O-acyltransferase (sialic acid O-acetyltransferase NeuD family)